MNAENFVAELKTCVPTKDQLLKMGLSKNEMSEFMQASHATKLAESEVKEEIDSLIDLISNYDLSTVRIGMVEFNENLTNTPLGLQIGSVEADILYIADNGELCVNEFGASHHLLWKCAKNGDAFLDALLIAACFLNDFSRDDEDMELCLESVKRCASAAGGERYLNFYLMLLGYDD